jgi:hypothetical protein
MEKEKLGVTIVSVIQILIGLFHIRYFVITGGAWFFLAFATYLRKRAAWKLNLIISPILIVITSFVYYFGESYSRILSLLL